MIMCAWGVGWGELLLIKRDVINKQVIYQHSFGDFVILFNLVHVWNQCIFLIELKYGVEMGPSRRYRWIVKGEFGK